MLHQQLVADTLLCCRMLFSMYSGINYPHGSVAQNPCLSAGIDYEIVPSGVYKKNRV